MKHTIALIALATALNAADVTLHWEPSPTREVNAYRLHAWRVSDQMLATNKPLFSITLPNITNAAASGLTFEQWTFRVTALVTNESGYVESPFSNPVTVKVVPQPPVLIGVK